MPFPGELLPGQSPFIGDNLTGLTPWEPSNGSGIDPTQLLLQMFAPKPEDPNKPPSAKIREQAKEFITTWLKRSYEFMEPKLEGYLLLYELYRSRRPLDLWRKSLGALTAAEKQEIEKSWRTQTVVSIAPIVNAFAHRAFQQMFSATDYVDVAIQPGTSEASIEDTAFPTSRKMAEMLKDDFEEAGFKSSRLQGFIQLALYGWECDVISFYERKLPYIIRDYKGRRIEREETLYTCPLIQPILPHNFLPDWTATNPNVQHWTGIGYRNTISYPTVIERFRTKVYNLGTKEFLDQWPDMQGGPDLTPSGTEIQVDEHTYLTPTGPRIKEFTEWHYHGLFPNEKGWTECVSTILTEKTATNPTTGVPVRLRLGTALACGLRPFAMATLMPVGEPFGVSLIEPHLDIIHQISTLKAMLLDNAKLGVQRQWGLLRSSKLGKKYSQKPNADIQYPGRVHLMDKQGELFPLDPAPMDTNTAVTLVQHDERSLESRTGTSDATLWMAQQRKTATGEMVTQQASITPITNVMQCYRETLLNPAGKIALSIIQQFADKDRFLTVKGPGGQPQQINITLEEIISGEYTVDFVLDRSDQTRIAKFNSLKEFIATVLMPMAPLFAQQGIKPNLEHLTTIALDLLQLDRLGEWFTRTPPPPPMLPPGMPGAPQGPGGPPMPGGPGMAQASNQPIMDGPRAIGPTDDEQVLRMIQELAREPGQDMAPIGNV